MDPSLNDDFPGRLITSSAMLRACPLRPSDDLLEELDGIIISDEKVS